MNVLDGIQNFLQFINDHWTNITVIFGLCIALAKKIECYLLIFHRNLWRLMKNGV